MMLDRDDEPEPQDPAPALSAAGDDGGGGDHDDEVVGDGGDDLLNPALAHSTLLSQQRQVYIDRPRPLAPTGNALGELKGCRR